jgi:hypothetical protein
MIDHVGVGKAMGRAFTVAEGNRRGRHDEAKYRDC